MSREPKHSAPPKVATKERAPPADVTDKFAPGASNEHVKQPGDAV